MAFLKFADYDMVEIIFCRGRGFEHRLSWKLPHAHACKKASTSLRFSMHAEKHCAISSEIESNVTVKKAVVNRSEGRLGVADNHSRDLAFVTEYHILSLLRQIVLRLSQKQL